MRSIHGKITLAYTAMAVVIIGLSVFAYLDLLYLERQVHKGVAVSDLGKATLEMRRQEKNLFLYGDKDARDEALQFATQAQNLLTSEETSLIALTTADELQRLGDDYSVYAIELADYAVGFPGSAQRELRIRQVGNLITGRIEELERRERQALATSIYESQRALVISFLLVGLAVLAVGQGLARAVVRPLRELQSRLAPIAEGQLNHLAVNSDDREIVTLTQAFNRMLGELDVRRRRLQQAEKLAALGVLTTGIAHEVNNPLSNISSSAQLLIEELDSATPEQLAEWASQIVGETDRAHRIVSALLDFGRQSEFRMHAVNLKEVIEKSLVLLRGPIRKANARIVVDVPDDLRVMADVQRLQQIFINLVRNALLVQDDTVTIRIHAGLHSGSESPFSGENIVIGEPECGTGTRVQIEISDDGPGIAADILPKIFDPFFTTREPGKGMGLGLYIVQEIVQLHEGCIAVGSLPGQGTRVILRLRHPGDDES